MISRAGFLRTVGVAVFGLVGGCVEVFPKTGIRVSFDGTLESTGDQFLVDGRLIGQGKINGVEFEAVNVRFLDASGAQFDREVIGQWRPADGPLEFEATAQTTPEYVLFDSPDFWTSSTPEITVYYWRRVDGGYSEYPADSRSELENPE